MPMHMNMHAQSHACCLHRGHASHVMDIRFNCDDTRVVSVGGLDRAVFQWQTAGIAQQNMEADKVRVQQDNEAEKVRVQQNMEADKVRPGTGWLALCSRIKQQARHTCKSCTESAGGVQVRRMGRVPRCSSIVFFSTAHVFLAL